MPENLRVSTSRNPKGFYGLYRDNFTFYKPINTWKTSGIPLLQSPPFPTKEIGSCVL
jgi:hypothetical protein